MHAFIYALLSLLVVPYASGIIHSIDLPPHRGSEKCFFYALLPDTDASLTFIPPVYESASQKKIAELKMRSSTITTTNYRVVIKSPTQSTPLTTLTISNTPDSKDRGGASVPSLLRLWERNGGRDMSAEDEDGDFEICISDNSRFGVGGGRVAFDVTEVDLDDGGKAGEGGGIDGLDGVVPPIKKAAVDPLLKAVSDAKKKAAHIVKEMDYMHRREIRMHRTSTSTNSRLFWFGVVSVGALVGVAAFQVVYLRGYFRRKKLL